MVHMAISVHSPPQRLTQADLPSVPLVTIELDRDLIGSKRDWQLMHKISVRSRVGGFDSDTVTFAVVYKTSWTAQSFEAAIKQLDSAAFSAPVLPLILLPYLDEAKLEVLATWQISGLDLCGNALLMVPGRLLVQRSGQPNRFKIERGLKSPYTGKASLVGRALLEQPHFETANELLAFIRTHGGDLSQALVSRTLKALEDDLVAEQGKGQGIMVLQPGKLLDRLVEGWKTYADRPANREERLLWRGRVSLADSSRSTSETMNAMLSAQTVHHQRLVMTGLSSAARWTNLSSGEMQSFYVDAVGDLLRGYNAEETRRFPNLELWRPPDEAVYFDALEDHYGRWASPVQTYLEMVTGDARTQDAAQALRASLLGKLESRKAMLLAGADQP